MRDLEEVDEKSDGVCLEHTFGVGSDMDGVYMKKSAPLGYNKGLFCNLNYISLRKLL